MRNGGVFLANAPSASDAWLERFLELVAHDAVGEAMVDARPAFVASGDGASLLWANASGLELLRAKTYAVLRDRALDRAGALGTQLARLSRILPTDRSRLQALPLGLTQWIGACRRLNLADGGRAGLAVGATPAPPATLRTRNERLVERMADDGYAAAVLDA